MAGYARAEPPELPLVLQTHALLRYLQQVTRRLGGDIQPLAAQLIKALTEACRADRSAAVRRSYAAAAALLCRHASSARVSRHISDALGLLGAEGADRDDRYVAGLLLRELGRESADVLANHASEVAPPAFMAQVRRQGRAGACGVGGMERGLGRRLALGRANWRADGLNLTPPAPHTLCSSPTSSAPRPGQYDEDGDVAAMWREVWEEVTASAGAGLRLHMGEVVQVRANGVVASREPRATCRCSSPACRIVQLQG